MLKRMVVLICCTFALGVLAAGPAAAQSAADTTQEKSKAAAHTTKAKTKAAAHESKQETKVAAAETKAKTKAAGEKADDKADAAQNKTSSTLSDAEITAAVKTKLLADSTVGGLKLDVDTDHGVVTITGPVRSGQELSQALRLARNTKGVRRVVNKMTMEKNVKPADKKSTEKK